MEAAGRRLGPYRAEQLAAQLARGELPPDCLVQEAGSDSWCPLAQALERCGFGRSEPAASATAVGAAPPPGRTLPQAVGRYREAYRDSLVVRGYGQFIKVSGLVIAGLGALLALFNIVGEFSVAVAFLFAGLVVGALFYVGGAIVSAQGQLLKAMLDLTVQSSPYLQEEDKLKTMF
ncbi:MAG: DUF4339 domain-containing protein [Verrucomicrobia bacterium]|nr:DUF4339 domain-containing protein [Verrucomicrobiota bacterium]